VQASKVFPYKIWGPFLCRHERVYIAKIKYKNRPYMKSVEEVETTLLKIRDNNTEIEVVEMMSS